MKITNVKQNKKIKRSTAGFTMTEMLAAVLVMSIVLAAVTAGMSAASRVYEQIRKKSDAQTLLSTTITELTADFSSARDGVLEGTDGAGAPTWTFYSEYMNGTITIQNGSGADKGIRVRYGTDPDMALVSGKISTLGLYTTLEVTENNMNGDFGQSLSFTVSVYDKSGNKIESQDVTVRNTVGTYT